MTYDWKHLTEEFVNGQEEIFNLENKIRIIFKRQNLPQDLHLIYDNIFEEHSRSDILEIIKNRITQQYSTHIFPAILTRERAANFWLSGEPEIPSENEAWKGIYLLLSSVSVGNVLINLDNISNEGRIAWRRLLFSEDPSQFYNGIRSTFNLHSKNWEQFFIALLAISFFTSRIRERIQKSNLGLDEYLHELQKEYSITDETSLVIFQLGRVKKEVHYFTKLTSFIRTWFKDYIEGLEQEPSLVKFLDSLTATDPKNKAKAVTFLREKLIFHLLRHNNINGKLLLQLVMIKLEDSLKKDKKLYGINYPKQFFAKL